MKRLLIIMLIGVGILQYLQGEPELLNSLIQSQAKSQSTDKAIAHAYQNKLSDIQVSGSGKVSQILKDDNEGSRHQRFILKVSSDHTVLVAHNIDLAPRLPSLKRGDSVQFYGEYEWNNLGGVLHWTHHDPKGYHVGGWLKYNGQKYE